MKTKVVLLFFLLPFCLFADVLPSWNEGIVKKAIMQFVQDAVANVPPEERIATFDQDGTLWVEHSLYTQAAFALDRIKVLAKSHPEWKEREPFKSVLSEDAKKIAGFSEQEWEEIIAVTHAGMNTEAFTSLVKEWIQKAKHPRFDRLYTQLVYQPMVEVIEYMQKNGFKTYIVTGGGQEFVRAYSQSVYGIPTEQVIGSSLATSYEYQKGVPVLMRLPKVSFIDDGKGKAIGIHRFIGKKPIAAFGNSNGDKEMLEWTEAGGNNRLMVLVLHDDPEREYAYGPADGLPDSKVGTFSEELMKEAKGRGWQIVSMKRDWKQIMAELP